MLDPILPKPPTCLLSERTPLSLAWLADYAWNVQLLAAMCLTNGPSFLVQRTADACGGYTLSFLEDVGWCQGMWVGAESVVVGLRS